MRYIGIDVSKKTLDVFSPPSTFKKVSNDEKGFTEIFSFLEKDDILGVESTGSYHHALALFCIKQEREIREINPILTKQFTKATIRGKKTDKTDAQIISLLLERGEGYAMQKERILCPLKKIVRLKRSLINQKSKLTLQLNDFPSGKDFAEARKVLQKLLDSFEKQIGKLSEEILKHQNKDIEILESIPGIKLNNSREILAELGDIMRFGGKKQLVAYGGYDPKLRQSGTSVFSAGRLTKRGSPFLRNALYLAVFANLRSNNVFGNYYKKKKSEGKHHTQAMVDTSRKMLEIIFTLLKKQEKFSPEFFLNSKENFQKISLAIS